MIPNNRATPRVLTLIDNFKIQNIKEDAESRISEVCVRRTQGMRNSFPGRINYYKKEFHTKF
jgi:hypothetical protein